MNAYQKLLKLDNPSSSYGKKNLVCFLCVTVYYNKSAVTDSTFVMLLLGY